MEQSFDDTLFQYLITYKYVFVLNVDVTPFTSLNTYIRDFNRNNFLQEHNRDILFRFDTNPYRLFIQVESRPLTKKSYNISSNEAKQAILQILNNNQIFLRHVYNPIPIGLVYMDDQRYLNQPLLIRYETKRLTYTQLVRNLGSFTVYASNSIMKSNYLRYVLNSGNVQGDIHKIDLYFNTGNNPNNDDNVIQIYLRNGEIKTFRIDRSIMTYIIDELILLKFLFQPLNLEGYIRLPESDDIMVQYYNNNVNLREARINAGIARLARRETPRDPFAGANPTQKVIQDDELRYSIGCNANSIEERDGFKYPQDPSSFVDIPKHLLVTAVPSNYDPLYPNQNAQTFCFDAHFLWEFWKQAATTNPPRPAMNPLNNLQFDEPSIVYVKNLLDETVNPPIMENDEVVYHRYV